MSDAKLICYDDDGNELFNSGNIITRIFGVARIQKNVSSGSITDARFSQGTPVFFHAPLSYPDGYEMTLTMSGNTLSWSRTGGSTTDTAVWTRIYYGVIPS